MNKSAIVTGASDGIGKGIALALARRGYSLGLLARREGLLRDVARQCEAAGAPAVELAVIDLARRDEHRAGLESLDDRLGGAGVFVANAGVDSNASASRDCSDEIRRVFEINVHAAIDGIELMKMRMLFRGGGNIAGVTSIAAARGLPKSGAYCASKAALHVYLQSLHIDLKDKGVRVTAVAPGFIDTPMTRGNPDPMPFLMSIERAGELFARDILHGKAVSVAPRQFIPIFWLLKAVPDSIFNLAGKTVSRLKSR
jgi:short-subunit dehydrogenase